MKGNKIKKYTNRVIKSIYIDSDLFKTWIELYPNLSNSITNLIKEKLDTLNIKNESKEIKVFRSEIGELNRQKEDDRINCDGYTLRESVRDLKLKALIQMIQLHTDKEDQAKQTDTRTKKL